MLLIQKKNIDILKMIFQKKIVLIANLKKITTLLIETFKQSKKRKAYFIFSKTFNIYH